MQKNICQQNFFVVAFLNAYYPKTHLIQSLNSINSSRPYGIGCYKTKRQGALKNYFCQKIISKLAPQKIKTSRFSRSGIQSKT